MKTSVAANQWYVYILRCADDTLYTGVTTNLVRRLREHNGELQGRGAKYTKIRRPVALFYSEQCSSRSTAQMREASVRKLSRAEKLLLPKLHETTVGEG